LNAQRRAHSRDNEGRHASHGDDPSKSAANDRTDELMRSAAR
jgi:hypothetical protein